MCFYTKKEINKFFSSSILFFLSMSCLDTFWMGAFVPVPRLACIQQNILVSLLVHIIRNIKTTTLYYYSWKKGLRPIWHKHNINTVYKLMKLCIYFTLTKNNILLLLMFYVAKIVKKITLTELTVFYGKMKI